MSEQAVAKTDEVAEPTSESVGAQEDDFESLLNQYTEETTPKVETKSEPVDDNRLSKAVGWIEQQQQAETQRRLTEDMDSAVKTVKSEMGDNAPSDRLVRGILHDMASQDQRVQKAWSNRGENPAAWKAVLKKAAKDLGEELGSKADSNLTNDREAMTAAVRGAQSSSKGDAAPNIQKMSDADFNKHLQDLGIG